MRVYVGEIENERREGKGKRKENIIILCGTQKNKVTRKKWKEEWENWENDRGRELEDRKHRESMKSRMRGIERDSER